MNVIFHAMNDSDALLSQLTMHRHLLIDCLWKWLARFALIAVCVSLSRFTYTGWLPLYNVHIVLGTVTVMVY